jgi:ribosome-associated heat shock protein Hsp15
VNEGAAAQIRLDKWLWHARVAKTRTLAQKLVTDGVVRINGQRAATVSRPVRIGDILTIATERRVLVFVVLGLGQRRGPASEAQLLYEDRSPAPPMGISGPSEGSGQG